MKITIELSVWCVQDIKRLLAESTPGADGTIQIITTRTWPHWIGAAAAHLQAIIEQVPTGAAPQPERERT